MSSVPVSQRKPSRLEAHHLALALGRSLTDLLSRSLGLSKQKMEARIAQRIRTVTQMIFTPSARTSRPL